LCSFPKAPVGSGRTLCNSIVRSDATPNWVIFETSPANFRKPVSVRRRVPSPRPTPPRLTPITTTALPFVVRVGVEGVRELQLVGEQRPLGEKSRCGF
jgi:hypothetical protein